MRYQPKLEFASLHCKFGDKNLLDYLDQIVLPAFLDESLKRKRGGSNFFIYNSGLVVLEDGDIPVIALIGHLVNDTVFESNQLFDTSKGLVPDNNRMPTSPSSLFALILNNHMLLYLEEMKHAPGMKSFRATIGDFMRRKHKEFIKRLKEEEELGLSDLELWEEHPAPRLELVPLSTKDVLKDFVYRFSRLQEVRIQFINTNDGVHNRDLFEALQEDKGLYGSDNTTLSHKKADGLNRDTAYEQLSDLPEDGNARFALAGRDMNGFRLAGNTDDLRLRVPMTHLPDDIVQRVAAMYNSFKANIQGAAFKLENATENVAVRLRELRERL
jgi:hypothetical protein